MNDDVRTIHDWFVRRGRTLAVAESLTCGNVQALIGARSGASKFFRGGVTCYYTDLKSELLNVDGVHANEVNAVSAQVAREMAYGVCQLHGADFGIGTTGYAEAWPDGGVPHPMAYVAIVNRNDETPLFSDQIFGPGLSRVDMQLHVARSVLGALAQLVMEMKD